jgi:hypothetical protein
MYRSNDAGMTARDAKHRHFALHHKSDGCPLWVIADICSARRHVRFGPKADIGASDI